MNSSGASLPMATAEAAIATANEDRTRDLSHMRAALALARRNLEPGGGDDRVSLFRPPGATAIRANPVMFLKNRIDHGPSGFHCILASEERSIADHGVA